MSDDMLRKRLMDQYGRILAETPSVGYGGAKRRYARLRKSALPEHRAHLAGLRYPSGRKRRPLSRRKRLEEIEHVAYADELARLKKLQSRGKGKGAFGRVSKVGRSARAYRAYPRIAQGSGLIGGIHVGGCDYVTQRGMGKYRRSKYSPKPRGMGLIGGAPPKYCRQAREPFSAKGKKMKRVRALKPGFKRVVKHLGQRLTSKQTPCQLAAAAGNPWIAHVRDVARANGISYAAALGDPATRASY